MNTENSDTKMQKKLLNFKSLFLLFYFLIVAVFARQKTPQYARFKTVKCSISNKTFNPNYTCTIKAYNRYVAKLNVLLHFDVLTHSIIVS